MDKKASVLPNKMSNEGLSLGIYLLTTRKEKRRRKS